MKTSKYATAESVAAGHPDKVADAISDALLDAHLAQDPHARVAAETLVHADPAHITGQVTLAGEITSKARHVDHEAIVRRVLRRIGYTDLQRHGFAADSVTILDTIGRQSPEIHRAAVQGAGDQGVVYGYATRETKTGIPLPLEISHALMRRLAEVRQKHDWLGPDGKAQVTAKDGRLEGLILSVPIGHEIAESEAERFVLEQICRPVLNRYDESWEGRVPLQFNTGGRWTVGGPLRDAGLTGRKLAVDTYGGLASHGGGAFSGKDASKMDRAGAYAARELALWLIQHPLWPEELTEVTVGLAFAIGVEQPVAIHLPGLNPGWVALFTDQIRSTFNLSPTAICQRLGLNRPIFERTAAFGHFGRPGEFPWEPKRELEPKQERGQERGQERKPRSEGYSSVILIPENFGRADADSLDWRRRLSAASDEKLLEIYIGEWNGQGWARARATKLGELAQELDRRFDCSAVLLADNRFLIGGPKRPVLENGSILLK
jgi:S-adenosylmethionine synthetase